MAKVNRNNNKASEETGQVFLLDKFVCAYIRDNWIDWSKPIEPQSKKLGVHRHILTKLQSQDGYRIPLSTLAIMCFYKQIPLSEFFKIIEAKHGSKINDDFVSKTVKPK